MIATCVETVYTVGATCVACKAEGPKEPIDVDDLRRCRRADSDAARRVAWLRLRALGWRRVRGRHVGIAWMQHLCPRCADRTAGRGE